MKRISALAAALLALLAGACHSGAEAEGQLRIVALSPEVAEIIAALDGTSNLVGVTRECDYPPQLTRIEQVGNFGAVNKEAILALKPGQLSGVVRTNYGYHLFFLEAKIRAHQQKLYEVRDRIRELLRLRKERAATEDLLERLYRKYQPRLSLNTLDFKPDPKLMSSYVILEITHEP